MIIDMLSRSSYYSGIGERYAKAFDWLHKADLSKMAVGRYDIDGDAVYAMVQENTTKAIADVQLEAHRRYADIQYLFEGEEWISWARIDSCTMVNYTEEKDFVQLNGVSELELCLHPGEFTVFFPEDVHRPGVSPTPGNHFKKVVVKIKL